MSELSITRGDKSTFNVTVKDEDDVLFDLTGYTMTFTAKENIGDTTDAISKDAVIATPASGIGVITLLPVDTTIDAQEYRYDIQIKDSGTNVYTVLKNSLLLITDEITV